MSIEALFTVPPSPFACQISFTQELCLDYGLDEASRDAVFRTVRNVEETPTNKEAIESTADAWRDILLKAKADQLVQEMARADALTKAEEQVAYLASPDIITSEYHGVKTKGGEGDLWPPVKVDEPRVMKQAAIIALPLQERKALAAGVLHVAAL